MSDKKTEVILSAPMPYVNLGDGLVVVELRELQEFHKSYLHKINKLEQLLEDEKHKN